MKQHHDDLHALAAAYALNALDARERELFAAHLSACVPCRREVFEFEATAARMGGAVSQAPPASMKQRVIADIDGVRQLPPRVSPGNGTATVWTALRRRAAAFAVAASLAAAVSFAGIAAWQHQESDDAARRAAQSEQRLDAVGEVLAAPDARSVQGRTDNGAGASVVSSQKLGKAVFITSGLPSPGSGKTYQLWLGQGGTMRSAGLIQGDGTVFLEGDTAHANAVGLTVEPAGGSTQPTTKPLLLLNMPA
ncbi:anti-sigma factor [Streptomyces sp. NPDC006197]|uniref:anti-sigma factor n=1 Tax=Streptomyces sp. NPDC006197 TaxID=3156685 RepID=UPI0033B38E45